jgi:hypothetical protein
VVSGGEEIRKQAAVLGRSAAHRCIAGARSRGGASHGDAGAESWFEPYSLELIGLVYQPWYNVFLSQQISKQYL